MPAARDRAACRRVLEQESRARDVRLQRALEEVERYKQLLHDVKQQVCAWRAMARGGCHACVAATRRRERGCWRMPSAAAALLAHMPQGQELKDAARGEHSKALGEVKRLQRQKAELLGVLRKQARLVEVLRRQRAHLEAARLLAFTEDEFMRMLDVGA